MNDTTNAVQKQQKVSRNICRSVKFVVPFKPLMTHRKEYKRIYKEKSIKDS